MKTFMEKEVVEILNFPPAPSPPGFTIVFMKDKGALKIVTAFNREAITISEITKFETTLKTSLRA